MIEQEARRAPALGFADFQAAALTQFVPLRVRTERQEAFRGSMRARRLDDITTVALRASAHTVERTPQLIGRGGGDRFKLTVQLAGTGLLVQDGRDATLRPGDVAIYDTGRPYSLAYDDACRILVLMFPRRLLALPPGTAGEVTAVRFAGDRGAGGVVSPLLRRLADPAPGLQPATALRLTLGALDLVATMIGEETAARPERDPHEALRRRVHAHIADRLAAPDLGPAGIAAAHHVSVRHLHAVFHGSGTTVAGVIRDLRLERCRRDLVDPLLADRSVGAIARRWGLADPAHFSRVFKAAFGVSPSEYRAGSGASAA